MRYEIDFVESALEQLRALPKDVRRLIGTKLRLRAGNYRVLFDWKQLNKQLVQAKTLLRQMSRTVEDIEDAPWAQIKKKGLS